MAVFHYDEAQLGAAPKGVRNKQAQALNWVFHLSHNQTLDLGHQHLGLQV